MNQFSLTILLLLADMCAAPYLWHVCRFPNVPRELIRANMSFNMSYRSFLEEHSLDRDSLWVNATLKESMLQWKAWNALDDAKNENMKVNYRRKALGELLSIIGPEAFFRGEMPCHIPLCRFREVR